MEKLKKSKTDILYSSEYKGDGLDDPEFSSDRLTLFWSKISFSNLPRRLGNTHVSQQTYVQESTPITQEMRSMDLRFHQERGNHKSAQKNKATLDKIIQEDVEIGFALPLPTQLLHLIPNASLAPLGCQEQETINELGEKIPRFRMTHDQLFPGPSSISVNLRVIEDDLPHCMYSFILCRSINYIISIRSKHPSTKILISKYNLDVAYHRRHLSGQTAQECLTIYNNIIVLALRMTFGGSPCPSLWGYISDTVEDVSNTILQCKDWDHNT
jgi:hypothetical protein